MCAIRVHVLRFVDVPIVYVLMLSGAPFSWSGIREAIQREVQLLPNQMVHSETQSASEQVTSTPPIIPLSKEDGGLARCKCS